MNATIDLGSEMLVDRSQVRDPYLRLLLTAIGQELARGSPWIAIDKKVASKHVPMLASVGRQFTRVST